MTRPTVSMPGTKGNGGSISPAGASIVSAIERDTKQASTSTTAEPGRGAGSAISSTESEGRSPWNKAAFMVVGFPPVAPRSPHHKCALRRHKHRTAKVEIGPTRGVHRPPLGQGLKIPGGALVHRLLYKDVP